MSSYIRSFPLYDNLATKLSQRPQFTLTPDYQLRIYNTLNNLSTEHFEQIGLLLMHFYFLMNPYTNPFTLSNCNHKSSNRSHLPFDIKTNSSGVGFSFDLIKSLPPQCQAILGIYCGL